MIFSSFIKGSVYFAIIVSMFFITDVVKAIDRNECVRRCTSAAGKCETAVGETTLKLSATGNNGIKVETATLNPYGQYLCAILNPNYSNATADDCQLINATTNAQNALTFTVSVAKDHQVIIGPSGELSGQTVCAGGTIKTAAINPSLPTPTVVPTAAANCMNVPDVSCRKLADGTVEPRKLCTGYFCGYRPGLESQGTVVIYGSPTPMPEFLDYGDESIESVVGKAKEQCGGSGERCCLPLGQVPQFSLSSIVGQVGGGWGSSLIGFLDKAMTSLVSPYIGNSIGEINQLALNNAICPKTQGTAELIYKSNPSKTVSVTSWTLGGEISDIKDVQTCSCVANELGQGPIAEIAKLCYNIPSDSQEYKDCTECSDRGIWTAAGCVEYEVEPFIQNFIFKYGIGLAGIFSLLCIAYASFIMQTSVNNPEKIKHAQDLMTSCITGLLLVIFSVFILRVIGVDILQLPGFGN